MFNDDSDVISDAELGRVAKLGEEMLFIQNWITATEADIKLQKERHDLIAEKLLPEVMNEIGLTNFGLKGGREITVEPVYKGYISVENRKPAIQWLRDNEFGEMVKNEIKVSFGMSEDNQALELVKVLNASGYSYEQKETVHPGTLNAFVREQTEKERVLPELLQPRVGEIARIKIKKGSK